MEIKREKLPFTEIAIKKYLDGCIKYWRIQRNNKKNQKEIAKYYIDAYQSIRSSIFGEIL